MNVLTQFAQSMRDGAISQGTDQRMFDEGEFFVVAGAFFGIFIVTATIVYIIHAFLLSRLFKKAGTPEWIAWVPFYNSWKLLELGNQPGFWAVLAVIPIINIASAVFVYIAMFHIGLKLQKEGWFVLLAIFVPIAWLIWLGFDSSKWNDNPEQALPTTPSQPPAQSTI